MDQDALRRKFASFDIISLLPLRSRERNRVHARNTRERKKSLMDSLQFRIQELIEEVQFFYFKLLRRPVHLIFNFMRLAEKKAEQQQVRVYGGGHLDGARGRR